MEVYIEYAVAENFILDFTLLYLAIKTVRLPVIKWRILLAGALGAAFAVLFPFFHLSGIWALAVKYIFGGMLCLMSVKSKSCKAHLLVILFFYLYTFAFGGLLLGTYTFLNLKYLSDGTYLISQAPVTVVLCVLLLFSFTLIKLFSSLYRRYRHKKLLYRCEISLNNVQTEGIGLLDTGNALTFKQTPVCLLDQSLALQFFDLEKGRALPCETLYVHTATGGGELKIFQASLKIYSEEKENIIDKVYFALAPTSLGKGYQIILHPQLFKEERRAKRTSAKNTQSMEKNHF